MSNPAILLVRLVDENGRTRQSTALWTPHDGGGDVFALMAALPVDYYRALKNSGGDGQFRDGQPSGKYWNLRSLVETGLPVGAPKGLPRPPFAKALARAAQCHALLEMSIGQVAARICATEIDQWMPHVTSATPQRTPDWVVEIAAANGMGLSVLELVDKIVARNAADPGGEKPRFDSIRVWETAANYGRTVSPAEITARIEHYNAKLIPRGLAVGYRRYHGKDGCVGLEYEIEPILLALAATDSAAGIPTAIQTPRAE